VAAYKNSLSEPQAEIVLDGGSLNITWNIDSDEHVIMSGPIAVSFLGDLSTLGIEK
jgi:diaminopimelate epimerase